MDQQNNTNTNTQQQQQEKIQQVILYQPVDQLLNYFPDMNDAATITVGAGPDDLEISAFFDQFFLPTPEFQEPAQTMDLNNQDIDDSLKVLEQLMGRTTIDQAHQTEGPSTQASQQPIDQHNQRD